MTATGNLDQEIQNVPLLADERGEEQEHEEYPPTSENGVGSSVASTSFHDQQFTEVPTTAHEISKDSWVQAFFVLTTGINSAYVLGYSDAIMVHLGWIAGVVGLIAATALSLYASILVAKIHELGGKRHIRYRDLAGYIYGKKGFYTVWILQYLILFMFDIGFIILGGSALEDVYGLFSDENALKLSYCSFIAGLVCFLFAIMAPHLSALGAWLGLSAVLSSIYIIVAIAISIKDGTNSSARDYSIPGTSVGKIFLTIGAISNLFVPFNTGMIPEIQATIRAPVVGNMVKALSVQLTIGALPLFAVMLCGYWAYGSSTSSYLLDNASGPVWAKALANIAAFLQSIISFHIFACPSYEYLDTTFGFNASGLGLQKLLLRVGLRGGYLAVISVIAALLPFIEDFIGLIGSVCVLPLTFVIPHHLYMMATKKKLSSLQKLWHWLNVIFFGVLSVAATVESVRLIVIDSKDSTIFGD
ncbi:hypothetical protein K2173_011097 [Erythroxylum novogranatense]|uniref:Amino acid transporter transmembrane domain-containing protein n=1 Tax=Erythroxylum novogranatense TaxID=1862640 RepID=A0AAV8T0G1_9ROSI|nr:hypothetical protein K2173_011097 [Erythroxylum novogranatense]